MEDYEKESRRLPGQTSASADLTTAAVEVRLTVTGELGTVHTRDVVEEAVKGAGV